MNRKAQKEVKHIALEAGADHVIMHKNGKVTAFRHYFYRMGLSAEKFAEQIKNALEAAGYTSTITCRDDWNAWPKDSNFITVIHSCEPNRSAVIDY